MTPAAITALLDRLEAAEKDSAHHKALAESALRVAKGWEGKCDALRARIEAMEKQEPVAWMHETRRDSDVVTDAVKHVWGKVAVGSMAAYSIPLYPAPGAQPAPSVPKCPYPCGWQNLLKHTIEDGAYLARSINEDEPVTENARAVTMRTVMRLRDVLMAINNAAPEAKP